MGTTNFDAVQASTFTGAVVGNVTGNLTGLALQGGSATAIAASGAIPITTLYSCLDSSGGALAMTLADGAVGQMKVIKCKTAGNNAVVTPANLRDGTTLTFDAANEVALLVFDGAEWCVVANSSTLA
jgi:hypothetical protein